MPALIGMGSQALRPAAPTRTATVQARSTTNPLSATQTIAGLLQQHIPVDQASGLVSGTVSPSQASPWQAYGGQSVSTPEGSTINGTVVAPHSPDVTAPSQPAATTTAFTPGLLDTFPAYQNAVDLEHEGIGSADAGLKSARERAIINFGDPSLAQMAGFGLDPQAGAFAQQNYLSGNSTLSRLDKAHQLAQQAIINRLASHGILGSGDLGYLQGDENQNYGNGVYDAQQSVLGQLAGLYSQYLDTRNSLDQTRINAMTDALNAYMANPDLYASTFGGSTSKTSNTNTGNTKTPTKTGTAANAAKPIGGPTKNPAANIMIRATSRGR